MSSRKKKGGRAEVELTFRRRLLVRDELDLIMAWIHIWRLVTKRADWGRTIEKAQDFGREG